MFAYESTALDGIAMSWHRAELPYVFANAGLVKTSTGGGDEVLALSKKMSQAWVNFARNGKPSAEGLPDWPAYTSERPTTMVFDAEPRVAVDLDRKCFRPLARSENAAAGWLCRYRRIHRYGDRQALKA
jgi:para-nitrobenzyl esterase